MDSSTKIFVTISKKTAYRKGRGISIDVPNELLLTPIIIRVEDSGLDQDYVEMNISDFMDDVMGDVKDFSKNLNRESGKVIFQLFYEIAEEIKAEHKWREDLNEGDSTQFFI